MKLCAFDAYINYERNFRKTDKDFTKESDYTLALLNFGWQKENR